MRTATCGIIALLVAPVAIWAQEAKIPAPRILEGHTGRVMHVAFGPDSKTLVSVCYYKKMFRWDVAEGKTTGQFKTDKLILAMGLSPDGKTLATGAQFEGPIRFFNVENQQSAGAFSAHAPYGAQSIVFSADGKTMVSGGADIRVWELNNKKPRIVKTIDLAEGQGVSRLALRPDGKLLASGNFGPRISLWEPESGKKLGPFYTIETKTPVTGLAFRSDGKILAGAGKMIHLWDFAGGDLPLASFTSHDGFINAIAFRPNSNLLVSAGIDKTVRLWDIGTQKNLATLELNTGAASLAMSPDGKTIAVGGEDGKIRIYDISSVNVPLAKVEGSSGQKAETPVDAIKATVQGVYPESDQVVVKRDDRLGGSWALVQKRMGFEVKIGGKDAMLKDLRPHDRVEVIMSKVEQRVLEVRLAKRDEALAKRSGEFQEIIRKNYPEDRSTNTFPRKVLSEAERQQRDQLTLEQTKKLLDDNAKDEVALDVYVWMLHTKNADLQAKGADLVLEHHAKNERMGELVSKVLAASKDRDKALAIAMKAGIDRYHLALACRTLGDAAYTKGDGPEAEKYYDLVVKEFADVNRSGQSLSFGIEPRLYELRHLWVGKKAPDLVCPAPDGMPIKLSDFKGKVVLLRLWHSGTLEPDAQELEKRLLAKYEGKPFMCIGVCEDANIEQAKKAIQDNRITWPVMWDGGRGVVKRKLQRDNPQLTMYVIDGDGIIRARGSQKMVDLTKVLDELLMK